MTAQPAHATASRTPRRLRMPVLAVLALAAALLAGCGTGQRAQTAIAAPVIDGVETSVGQIDLRAVTIKFPNSGSYPAGGTAQVELYIVNNGSADQLISVSSSAAKTATLYASGATAFSIPPTTAAPTPTPTPTPTPATSASSSSSKSASGSASASVATSSASTSAAPTTSASTSTASTSTAPPAPVTVALPGGETTMIGVSSANAQLLLAGLNTALYPAMSIPITFSFATAGTVTLQVSVHLSSGDISAPTLATSHATSD